MTTKPPTIGTRAWARPLAGCRVRVPPGGLLHTLPADGAWVTWDHYWQRRLAEGSVEVLAAKPRPARKRRKPRQL